MKTILMSTRPQWVHKIFTRQKTIEVRKTAPEPPFKVVVYCTLSGAKEAFESWGKDVAKWNRENWGERKGKVVGGFICNRVEPWTMEEYGVLKGYENPRLLEFLRRSCLDLDAFQDYGHFKTLYGIHITDPILYDKPKDISEIFTSLSDKVLDNGDYDCRMPGDVMCMDAPEGGDYCAECSFGGRKAVSRPPQSWQYIVDPEACDE